MTERVRPKEIPWEHSFDDSCPWTLSIQKRPGFWREIRETQGVHKEARRILRGFLASEQELVQSVTTNQSFDAHACAKGTVLHFEEEYKNCFGETQSVTYWGIAVDGQEPFSSGDRMVIACYGANLIARGQPQTWPNLRSPVFNVGVEEHRRVKRPDGATDETLSRIKWLEVWQGVDLTTTEVRPKQAA